MTNGVAPAAPKELYGMFAGPIDQAAAQRISNAMSFAINNGVEGIHLLFQWAVETSEMEFIFSTCFVPYQ